MSSHVVRVASAAAAASGYGLLTVGSVSGATTWAADHIIREAPRGAYTTARTHGRHAVFELDTHVARTAESARLMRAAESAAEGSGGGGGGGGDAPSHADPLAAITTAAGLRPLLVRALADAVRGFEVMQAQLVAEAAAVPVDAALAASAEAAAAAAATAATAAATQPGVGAAASAAGSALACDAGVGLLVGVGGEAGAAPPAVAAPAPAPDVEADVELKLTLLLTWGANRAAHAFAALGPAFQHDAPRTAAAAEAASAAAGSAPPFLLITHVRSLPRRTAPPVRVLAAGAPRANATAKDSEWVRARTALEAAKPAGYEEVLLVAPGGALLEGTQTNFFAVQGGRVLTAGGDTVLGGSVRRLVLEVCAAEGIPLDAHAPPLLRDAHTWSGAFLTSTSRLVLPVDVLAYAPGAVEGGSGGGGGGLVAAALMEVAIPSASDALVARLERLVADAVAAHSVPLPV